MSKKNNSNWPSKEEYEDIMKTILYYQEKKMKSIKGQSCEIGLSKLQQESYLQGKGYGLPLLTEYPNFVKYYVDHECALILFVDDFNNIYPKSIRAADRDYPKYKNLIKLTHEEFNNIVVNNLK